MNNNTNPSTPKRYKLLKDTPSVNAGVVIKWNEQMGLYMPEQKQQIDSKTGGLFYLAFPKELVEMSYDWFQEIKEEERPNLSEMCEYYADEAYNLGVDNCVIVVDRYLSVMMYECSSTAKNELIQKLNNLKKKP